MKIRHFSLKEWNQSTLIRDFIRLIELVEKWQSETPSKIGPIVIHCLWVKSITSNYSECMIFVPVRAIEFNISHLVAYRKSSWCFRLTIHIITVIFWNSPQITINSMTNRILSYTKRVILVKKKLCCDHYLDSH